MARFSGKQDLGKSQIAHRANKKRTHNQPKGTPPYEYKPVEKPEFIPMKPQMIKPIDLLKFLIILTL